jgi:heterodisulfide reductase subunit D
MTTDLQSQLKRSGALICLECGKCTAVCPIARKSGGFSPRRLLAQAIASNDLSALQGESLYSCLTCMACDAVCPSGISMTYVIKEIRSLVGFSPSAAVCSHAGAMQSLAHIMNADALSQNRLDWLKDDDSKGFKWVKKGEIALFIGCSPYFDVLFSQQSAHTLDIAKSAVRVLNNIGIKPVLLENERCCGHDLAWMGDEAGLRRLAKHNLQEIEKSGAKTVIFICPECLLAFREDYARLGLPLPFTSIHITQFLQGHLQGLSATIPDTVITYQDPCRLARHMGIIDEPRLMLGWIKGARLQEMKRHGRRAVCCAGNTWLLCGRANKEIQVERLQEARATGAQTLVTACPKCQIHFGCAMQDPYLGDKIRMEMKDIIVLLNEGMRD